MPATQSFPRPAYRVYAALDRVPVLRRSFNAKVLTVAFVGTHLPLLGILVYLGTTGALSDARSLWILGSGLLATLIGFGLTAYILHALLRPVAVNKDMLQAYREHGHLLPPPIQLDDEMGELLRGTADTLAQLDGYLVRVASEDPVTGVLNARGLRARLREVPEDTVVVLLQLREFAGVEAALGHEASEFVIRTALDRARFEFPEALAYAVPAPGRLALALPARDSAALDRRLQRLLEVLGRGVPVRDRDLRLEAAAGLARRRGGESPLRALAAAEVALLAALEQQGRAVVDAAIGGAAFLARLELGAELERAMESGEVLAVFQPRVRVADGRVSSVETLVRWNHPRRGLLSPDAFLDLAESNDRIVALGRLMLDRAAAQAAAWRGRGVVVSVNVAARQLQAGTLVEDVRAALARYDLEPAALELEITESSLLLDLEDARGQLEALRDLGVGLALDDFGTGYSSLSYLGSIPVDRVKLDWSFVRQLHLPRIELLVRSIIELAHRLGLRVTAEGVESRTQAEQLRRLGCDELQGYLFGRPAAPEEVLWEQGQPG